MFSYIRRKFGFTNAADKLVIAEQHIEYLRNELRQSDRRVLDANDKIYRQYEEINELTERVNQLTKENQLIRQLIDLADQVDKLTPASTTDDIEQLTLDYGC